MHVKAILKFTTILKFWHIALKRDGQNHQNLESPRKENYFKLYETMKLIYTQYNIIL